MRPSRYTSAALVAVALVAGAGAAHAAADPCATFFWTGSPVAVARYQPRYLIGQGLEDVNMGQITGTRIRYKWSTQAASCIASSNSYGYFFNPSFNQTTCAVGDGCTGTRAKRMSERLADILNVVTALSTANPDPTYQANLNTALVASFQVIDAIGAGTDDHRQLLRRSDQRVQPLHLAAHGCRKPGIAGQHADRGHGRAVLR